MVGPLAGLSRGSRVPILVYTIAMPAIKHKRRVIKCGVCLSPEVDKLNRDMILHGMSAPELEKKYGYLARTINNHRGHVTQKMQLAQERKQHDAAALLLEDVEKLWEEATDFLEVSKSAVKTQAITEMVKVRERQPNGSFIERMMPKTSYKEYRDLGATATAIRVAQENRRLFGDVTGTIRPVQDKVVAGPVLYVVLPGMTKLSQGEGKVIDVKSEVVED